MRALTLMPGTLPLRPALAATASVAVLSLALSVQAQQSDAPALTFGIETSLHADDNQRLDITSPGTTTWAETRLSFGLHPQTQASRLGIDASVILRAADLPGSGPGTGSETDIDDPRLRLSWQTSTGSTELRLDGEYRRQDISFADPLLLTNVDSTDLILDRGERETMSLALGFRSGIGGPLGFDLTLGQARRNYQGTSDPDLYNTRNDRIEATLRATLSPVAEGRVIVTRRDYTAEDRRNTERVTDTVQLGLDYALSSATRLETRLGYSQIDSERDLVVGGTARSTTRESAPVGRIALTRDLPDGRIGIALDQTLSTNGDRATLRVSRLMEFPLGSLDVNIGGSSQEGGDVALVGGLALSRELPRGEITLGLDRRVRTNDDDLNTETTELKLGWRHEISPLSDLSADIGFAEVDEDQGDNYRRARATIALAREITPDWDLNFGYEYRFRDESDEAGSARSNSVFVTLERKFGTGL